MKLPSIQQVFLEAKRAARRFPRLHLRRRSGKTAITSFTVDIAYTARR